MRRLFILLGILAGTITYAAPPPQPLFFNPPGSPFTITSFSFQYDSLNRVSDGVYARPIITNASSQTLQAYQIGFIFYGPFNNELEARGGLSMRDVAAGQSASPVWAFRFSGDFATTTVIAFPLRARTADGKIWVADNGYITEQVQKLVGAGFDPKKLEQP